MALEAGIWIINMCCMNNNIARIVALNIETANGPFQIQLDEPHVNKLSAPTLFVMS